MQLNYTRPGLTPSQAPPSAHREYDGEENSRDLPEEPALCGERLEAVLSARPYLHQLVAVAQEPQHLAALERRAVHLRELSPQQVKDEPCISAVILVPPLRQSPDLGRIPNEHPVAEALQQFDESCAVAAGLYPNDHFACQAGVEATDIIPSVL